MAIPVLKDSSDRLTDCTYFGDPNMASVGTVTSVALSMPAEFAVTGSPVTASGTLGVTAATQTANTVWAGPVSGAAAAPGFRAIVADDVPATLNNSTLDRLVAGGGTYSLQGNFDASSRSTTRGVEIVVGSNASGDTSGAAALLVEQFVGDDITVVAGHAINVISKKVGGTGAANARSGGINIEVIDTIGWGGVGAQAFCEGLHSKAIAAWPAGVQGSVQCAVMEAVIDTVSGPTDFGYVNPLEVGLWNKCKDPGVKAWGTAGSPGTADTLNGIWPGVLTVNAQFFAYGQAGTYPGNVAISVGNGFFTATDEGQFYNGIIVRDNAIKTGGYIFRSTPFSVAKSGNVTVGNGAGGTDAGYPLGLISTYATTNDVQVLKSMHRRTSGTAAAGMGAAERVVLDDDSGTGVEVFQSNYEWINPAAGVRSAKWTAFVRDFGGARTLWVAASDGSQPLLGFYGNGAIARQTVSGRGDAALASVAAALDNLGLVTDTTAAGDYEGEKTLTESADTAFVDIACPANSAAGGECLYTVEANDSTDFQMRTGRVRFSAVNKASTMTQSLVDVGTQDVAVSSGTLTASLSIIAGTNSVRLRCNAVSSLAQTTLRIRYRIQQPFTTTTVTGL